MLDDTLGLASPADVRALPDGGFAVVDMPLDEVLVLDGSLDVVARAGGSGSGPGELKSPSRLSLAGDVLGVADEGNGRVVFMNAHSLDPIESLAFPGLSEFALLASGEVVALPPDSVAVAYTYSRERATVAFESAPSLPVTRFEDDHRVATRLVSDAFEGRVFIWDEGGAAIIEYDARTGSVLDVGLLPTAFRDPLFASAQAGLRNWVAMGLTVPADRTIFRDLVRMGPRRVLLLTGEQESLGLVVDFADRTVRELMPLDDPELRWAIRPGTAAIRGDTMIALSFGRVDLLRLELPGG